MIENVIIMGAAGRDFHNFNIYFKNNPRYRVVAFTATQIPDIDDRLYPPALAGDIYPHGVPIYHEKDLGDLIREHKVDLVAFSYSDVPHTDVMHKASRVMAEGADFILIGATYTMLRASKPVVAVCAVRTGCGKSQTTRKVCRIVKDRGKRVVAVRHPMPYGDLTQQVVQRFARHDDFDRHQCTIEEREEYEPLVDQGIVVYAGIDYQAILTEAEKEADIIVWDGGNNDTPFYYPDVHIVVFDPHRAGHECLYYPGETNMIMADIAVINKVDSAAADNIAIVRNNIATHAPEADIVLAESAILVDSPEQIKGKRVLVVEDGPTLTHGDMTFGAGTIAARRYGAAELVEAARYAVGSLRDTYASYPQIRQVLPAMGYGPQQVNDLEATIRAAECDLVLCATPIDLPRLLQIDKPTLRVRYEYQDSPGGLQLEEVLTRRLAI
ncbi:MAG: cyclic 2,3-diphosphoglycerate synthase [Deltaproteobacteria bacterium]|nr:cyclic 2,3-diphosphoglycerate synthase [Deltaproteobacteria bacterium]